MNKKNKTSKIVLIILCVYLVIFTGICLWLFYERSAVPDSLIVAVFTAALGECSILGIIRTTKQKYPDTTQVEDDTIEEDFTEEV